MDRKYKRGERIWTICEFLNQELVWWNGKVYHRGFLWSWQLSWIVTRLNDGQFFKVEELEEKAK